MPVDVDKANLDLMPLGSLFELSVHVLFESSIAEARKIARVSHSSMLANHTILE